MVGTWPSNAGGEGSIPGQGAKTPHATPKHKTQKQTNKKKHNYFQRINVIICIENSTEYPIIFCISKPSSNSNKILKSVAFLNGNPLQYSCLENPMDGGAWWAAVHGVAKSRTRLSDFIFTFHFHALEKEMATHSSVLAWRIPGTGKPGRLPSMGLHRVGHD